MAFKHISRALRDGCRLHAFRSGGGLRVIRIEKGKGEKLVGYGEHPHVREALRLANKTLGPLGRIPRKSVYLTGSASAEDELDTWILAGREFDAWLEDGQIVVRLLNRSYRDSCPQPILEEALRNGSAEWRHRGGVTRIHSVSCRCHMGHAFGGDFDETHWSYGLETVKRLSKPASYPVAKTGRGKDFDEALKNALEATQVEIELKSAA